MSGRHLRQTAAVFAPLGPAAVVIGLLDVVATGASFGWRVMGLMMAASGVIWSVVACRIAGIARGRRANTLDVVLFFSGALSGMALGVVLAGSTIAALGRRRLPKQIATDPITLLFLGSLTLLVLVCAWSIRHNLSTLRHLFKPLTAFLATVGVTLWALFQFWYTNHYAPANVGTFLNLKTTLTEPDVAAGGMRPVLASVTISNPGSARTTIVASELLVTGSVMAAQPRRSPEVVVSEQADVFSRATGFPQSFFSRDSVEEKWTVLQRGKLVPEGTWLEPKEELTVEQTVYVDEERTDLVRVVAQLVAADGQRVVVGSEPRVEPTTDPRGRGSTVITVWPVLEPSLTRKLITGAPDLLTNYVVGHTGPGASAFLYWGGESSEEILEEHEHRRQLVSTSSAAELPLKPLSTDRPGR